MYISGLDISTQNILFSDHGLVIMLHWALNSFFYFGFQKMPDCITKLKPTRNFLPTIIKKKKTISSQVCTNKMIKRELNTSLVKSESLFTGFSKI